MRTMGIILAAIVGLATMSSAQSKFEPASVNVRFSEQISNGPAGDCGCFAMQGVAGDIAWRLHRFNKENAQTLGGVADISVEHTGSVNNAPYGLTLTTLAFGPRFVSAAPYNTQVFAQTLFGFTHGSNTQFPVQNTFESSANSFALDLGAGVERPLTRKLNVRILQIEYLRTGLPNGTSDWQNNLRLSAGVTVHWR